MAWDNAVARIDERVEKVRNFACRLAEIEIRHILAELQARFKRHTFQVVDGMGVTFVDVAPEVLGECNLYNIADRIDDRAQDLSDFLKEREAEVQRIYTYMDSELGTSIGPIKL